MRLPFAKATLLAGALAACGNKPSGSEPSTTPPPPPPASSDKTAAASSSAPGAPAAAASSAGATAPAGTAPVASAEPAARTAPEGMVAIPAGFYLMGGNGLDDKPEHEVAIAAFYADKMEVTMASYEKCVTAGKCEQLKDDNPFCNIKLKDHDKHPANCMTFGMAEAYCSFVGSRLPTEREWEYLAKGGSKQQLYSWGDNDPTDKIACYMHPGGSCEVGQFPPGAFGLYDVSGNVNEWTSSWYAPYSEGEATKGFRKVYRGGSWSRRFPKWLRSELRNHFKLDEEGAHLGVRCARSITPLECPTDAAEKDGVCVRTSGTPMDPQALLEARMARLEGGGGNGTATPAGSNSSAATDSPPSKWGDTPVKIRSAEFDDDCKKHYQGKPSGYTFRGGSFAAREPVVASSGCVKRDIGAGWTSVCCPG
ncbi:MAG: SUMF1/EgtB/PvdO family nonheme iron enzyme [Polyangiaceae bacterium]